MCEKIGEERLLPSIAILGGTFNPVHYGHLRLALSVAHALNLERVELTPAMTPPHKPARGILPFALRCELLEAAMAGEKQLTLSRLEAELPQPSYTWNLVRAWKERHEGQSPLFILGAEDFAQVEGWCRGLELPDATHFLVVPRGRADAADFCRVVERMRPGSRVDRISPEALAAGGPLQDDADEEKGEALLAHFSGTHKALFLPLPVLDVASSGLRERWLRGESLRFLTPDAVIAGIEAQSDFVRACWTEKQIFPRSQA